MDNMLNTVISQFANSPRLLLALESFNQVVDPTTLIDDWYANVWNPQTATGYGLDVWGRIVGVSRVVKIVPTKYFGFNQQVPGTTTFGLGAFYSGAATTQNYALSDDVYRRLIFAKGLVNISDNSITTINKMLMSLFPTQGRAYVKDNGGMAIEYVFEWDMSAVDQAIAISSGILPRPSGCSVTYTIKSS